MWIYIYIYIVRAARPGAVRTCRSCTWTSRGWPCPRAAFVFVYLTTQNIALNP